MIWKSLKYSQTFFLISKITKLTKERGWWFSTPDDSYMATEKSAIDNGFDATIDFIGTVLKVGFFFQVS